MIPMILNSNGRKLIHMQIRQGKAKKIDLIRNYGNCGGTVSQQVEPGQASAPITSQTANPTLELQRSTTTSQPGLGARTCEDCLDVLNDDQQAAFEQQLPIQIREDITTIEELCEFMNHLHIDPDDVLIQMRQQPQKGMSIWPQQQQEFLKVLQRA